MPHRSRLVANLKAGSLASVTWLFDDQSVTGTLYKPRCPCGDQGRLAWPPPLLPRHPARRESRNRPAVRLMGLPGISDLRGLDMTPFFCQAEFGRLVSTMSRLFF